MQLPPFRTNLWFRGSSETRFDCGAAIVNDNGLVQQHRRRFDGPFIGTTAQGQQASNVLCDGLTGGVWHIFCHYCIAFECRTDIQ